MEQEYTDGPGGLSGNDDAGQMSAWYIFAAMGFYPLDPVSGQYQLSSPLFDEVTLHLPDSKTFIIRVKKASKTSAYIQAMLLNGKDHPEHSIGHNDIMKGGLLEVVLQDTP